MAAELRTRARSGGPAGAELENLAQCYTRLAEQAEENEALDLTYEPDLKSDASDS